MTQTPITSYAQAPTRSMTVDGKTFVYRELGPREEIPVVFFVHLAANLDNWDPRIVDAVAAHRHVITFDQQGVGASPGKVAPTIEAAAEDAYRFITGLGYSKVDIFAFSMGGFIAQDLIVANPGIARKLVLTGTGPRGGKNIHRVVATTYYDIFRSLLARTDPKAFLFFNRDSAGKQAAQDFLNRLKERAVDRDQPVGLGALNTQLKAIWHYGRSAPSDLSRFPHQTLIANGDHDRMVPTELSEDMHRRILGSELIIYPNSGHGGIFQYHEEFAPALVDFLKN